MEAHPADGRRNQQEIRRKRRTAILIQDRSGLAARLAQEILDRYEASDLEVANNGLIMIKAREQVKRSLFYLGEVLITECKVMINESPGIGMVQGHQPELAYQLAVIDAACNAGLPEIDQWQAAMLEAGERIARQNQLYNQRVMQTQVSFETMSI